MPNPSNPQDFNRYSYCNNNPINYTDPTGHSWFSKHWKQIVGAVGTIASMFVPALAPAMWAINTAISAYTAIDTGSIAAFAGGMIGGIVGGGLGRGIGQAFAGALGVNTTFSFLGGAIIGAGEFGMSGFGAGFGAAVGGGASFSEAVSAGGMGAAIGAATGAAIQGSYNAGWQSGLHGLSKEELIQTHLNKAVAGSLGQASRILGDLQKKFDMVLLGIKGVDPTGIAIHPNVYATTTSGNSAGVGFDFAPKTPGNFLKVFAGGKVDGIFSAKDFSNIANMRYDLLILKSADPSVVNRAIPIIEGYVGRAHYYKLYGQGSYTCQDGAGQVLSDIGLQ